MTYLYLLAVLQLVSLLFIFGVMAAFFRLWFAQTHVAFAASIVVVGLIAAAYFWIALWWIQVANWMRLPFFLFVMYVAYKAYSRKLYDRELVFPLSCLAGGSCFLVVMIFVKSNPDNILQSVANIWRGMPLDNEIPYIFAMNLWNGKISVPLLPEWHASDRPPLQSALFLLLQAGIRPNPIRYELFGIILQMTALPSLWCLLRTVHVKNSSAIIIVIIAFLTPMTILNGVFIWPKLIAVSFLCCATVFLLSDLSSNRPYLTAILFGFAIGLASLCHGTAIFSLPAFAVIWFVRINNDRFRAGLCAGVAFTVLYLPWIGFQKLYDPPGDRLLKYHLAGVVAYTEEPLMPLLKKAYEGKSVSEIYTIRKFGVTDVVFGLIPETYESLGVTMISSLSFTAPPAQLLSDLRDREFLRLIPSMGIIGLLCPLLLIGLFMHHIRPLTIVVLGTLTFWVATIYDPFGMIPHTGSYIIQFFTIAGVGAVLAVVAPWLLLPLLFLHAWAIAAVYLLN